MRKVSFAVAILLSLLSVSWASAQVDQDALSKALHKHMLHGKKPSTKPKATCVCQDGSANHGAAGILFEDTAAVGAGLRTLKVECLILHFDSTTGEFVTNTSCTTFEVLGK